MAQCVLDASVTVAWYLPDEQCTYANTTLAWLSSGNAAVVPMSWRVEVANVMWVAERRKRVTVAESDRFLEQLDEYPITVDLADSMAIIQRALSLARAYSLAAYDAAYLELAIRHGLPLATTDGALLRAMRAVGVPLLRP
jgi:predicted nucleic acid-binding protein